MLPFFLSLNSVFFQRSDRSAAVLRIIIFVSIIPPHIIFFRPVSIHFCLNQLSHGDDVAKIVTVPPLGSEIVIATLWKARLPLGHTQTYWGLANKKQSSLPRYYFILPWRVNRGKDLFFSLLPALVLSILTRHIIIMQSYCIIGISLALISILDKQCSSAYISTINNLIQYNFSLHETE